MSRILTLSQRSRVPQFLTKRPLHSHWSGPGQNQPRLWYERRFVVLGETRVRSVSVSAPLLAPAQSTRVAVSRSIWSSEDHPSKGQTLPPRDGPDVIWRQPKDEHVQRIASKQGSPNRNIKRRYNEKDTLAIERSVRQLKALSVEYLQNKEEEQNLTDTEKLWKSWESELSTFSSWFRTDGASDETSQQQQQQPTRGPPQPQQQPSNDETHPPDLWQSVSNEMKHWFMIRRPVRDGIDDSVSMDGPVNAETKMRNARALLEGWGEVAPYLSSEQLVSVVDTVDELAMTMMTEIKENDEPVAPIITFVTKLWTEVNNPHRPEHLFEAMLERQKELPFEFTPTLSLYGNVLKGWTDYGKIDKRHELEARGRVLYWLGKLKDDPNVQTSPFVYQKTLSNFRSDPRSAEHFFRNKVPKGQRTAIVYQALMQVWADSRKPQAKTEIRALLDELKAAYDASDGNRRLFPTSDVFQVLLQLSTGQEGEAILAEMRHWARKDRRANPTYYEFCPVIEAYAEEGNPARAEALLMKMLDLHEAGHPKVRPSQYVSISTPCRFVCVLVCVFVGTPNRQYHLSLIVQELSSRHTGISFFRFRLYTRTYLCTVVWACGYIYICVCVALWFVGAFSGALLFLPFFCFNVGWLVGWLRLQNYTALMKAWINTETVQGVRAAERVLQEIERLASPHADPNTRFDVLRLFSFRLMMNTYAKTNGFCDNAERLLRRMDTYARMYDNPRIRPTIQDYAAVMQSYSIDKPAGYVGKIMTLLGEMESSNDPSHYPDLGIYEMVLRVLFHSGSDSATGLAESVLKNMRRFVQPNSACFRWVFEMYNSTDQLAGLESILKQMQNEEKRGNWSAAPDNSAYQTAFRLVAKKWHNSEIGAMESWSKCNHYFFGQLYFSEQPRKKATWSSISRGLRKDFHDLLQILHTVPVPDKVERVKEMLQRLNRLPTFTLHLDGFVAVADICIGEAELHRETDGMTTSHAARAKRKALSLAVSTFASFIKHHKKCSPVAYTKMLLCYGQLLSDEEERNERLDACFEHCCREGLVDESVYRTFVALSPWSRLLDPFRQERNHVPSFHHLPPEWKRFIHKATNKV